MVSKFAQASAGSRGTVALLLFWGLAAGTLCTTDVVSAAPAKPDAKRSIAVIEYRSGSSVFPDIGKRVAALLREKTSLKVMDPDDARQTYGRELDRHVARCVGDATCLAGIGEQLQAREVLLIGVSRFGDDIVTVQRIHVGKKRVLTRVADAMAKGNEPDDGALLGYVKQVLPKSDFVRYGVIRIEAALVGASVVIGGQPRGQTPLKPLRVRAPATYDIEVEKRGFTPFRASVDVPPDAVVRVRTALSRKSAAPWYKRWWVVALVGGAVVGTVTAVALSRDTPSDLPVVIRF